MTTVGQITREAEAQVSRFVAGGEKGPPWDPYPGPMSLPEAQIESERLMLGRLRPRRLQGTVDSPDPEAILGPERARRDEMGPPSGSEGGLDARVALARLREWELDASLSAQRYREERERLVKLGILRS
jgi:hypothetical protein